MLCHPAFTLLLYTQFINQNEPINLYILLCCFYVITKLVCKLRVFISHLHVRCLAPQILFTHTIKSIELRSGFKSHCRWKSKSYWFRMKNKPIMWNYVSCNPGEFEFNIRFHTSRFLQERFSLACWTNSSPHSQPLQL